MKFKDLLCFYRVISWRHKISGWRPLLYTFFAYAVSGECHSFLYAINTFAWVSPFLVFGPFDDYWDFRIKGEYNFVTYLIKEKKFSHKKIFALIGLPLIFAFFILFIVRLGANPISVWLYILTFLTVICYAAPPFRLKRNKVIGFIVAPFVISLLFLQSYLLTNRLTATVVCIACLIVLFQSYAEALHRLDVAKSSLQEKEKKYLLFAFYKLPFVILFCSYVFVFINPIFILSAVCACIRLIIIKRRPIEYLLRSRRRVLHPVLSLYDFCIYAILGGLGLVTF